MPATKSSQFRKGSGCFKCTSCGKPTRHTGEQAIGSELCPQCWREAGLENEHSDTNGQHYGDGPVADCPLCRELAEAAPAMVRVPVGRQDLLPQGDAGDCLVDWCYRNARRGGDVTVNCGGMVRTWDGIPVAAFHGGYEQARAALEVMGFKGVANGPLQRWRLPAEG